MRFLRFSSRFLSVLRIFIKLAASHELLSTTTPVGTIDTCVVECGPWIRHRKWKDRRKLCSLLLFTRYIRHDWNFMNSHTGVGENEKHPVFNTILTNMFSKNMSLVVESAPECMRHSSLSIGLFCHCFNIWAWLCACCLIFTSLVLSSQEVSLMTIYLKTDLSTPAN